MIENIEYEKSFLKQQSKLISKHALTQRQIDETIELYKHNKLDPKLHYHSICCKKDLYRKSISVIGTNQQYKMLFYSKDQRIQNSKDQRIQRIKGSKGSKDPKDQRMKGQVLGINMLKMNYAII